MTFNPNEHLMQLQGKDYLPVAWRLCWYRDLCPEGSISTEMVTLDLDRETTEEISVWNDQTRRKEKVMKRANGFVIFRATVTDGRGGSATATKSEKAASFPDYIEKCETGAVGRALAMLGYGTQFTGEEFDEGERLADAPVDRGKSNGHTHEQKVVENAKPETDEPGVPTVKELQERCAKLFGVGFFQTMVLKALQREEPIRERDLLVEHRARIAKYLDFVEQQQAKAGEQPAA